MCQKRDIRVCQGTWRKSTRISSHSPRTTALFHLASGHQPVHSQLHTLQLHTSTRSKGVSFPAPVLENLYAHLIQAVYPHPSLALPPTHSSLHVYRLVFVCLFVCADLIWAFSPSNMGRLMRVENGVLGRSMTRRICMLHVRWTGDDYLRTWGRG